MASRPPSSRPLHSLRRSRKVESRHRDVESPTDRPTDRTRRSSAPDPNSPHSPRIQSAPLVSKRARHATSLPPACRKTSGILPPLLRPPRLTWPETFQKATRRDPKSPTMAPSTLSTPLLPWSTTYSPRSDPEVNLACTTSPFVL
jgi:hypothetical protein